MLPVRALPALLPERLPLILPLIPALLLAAPALAQGGRFPDPDATGSLRGGRDVRDIVPRTGPQACQRWCEADHVPCDPPNFKIADGRCRPFGGGRF